MAGTAPEKPWFENMLGMLCCSIEVEVETVPHAFHEPPSGGAETFHETSSSSSPPPAPPSRDRSGTDDSNDDAINAMTDPIAQMEERRRQKIAAMEAAELDARSAGDDGADAVLLLLTGTPSILVDSDQQMLKNIFLGRRIAVREIDGAHTAQREKLVAISGKRGVYPQVCLVTPARACVMWRFPNLCVALDTSHIHRLRSCVFCSMIRCLAGLSAQRCERVPPCIHQRTVLPRSATGIHTHRRHDPFCR